jgi:hypothetical protein
MIIATILIVSLIYSCGDDTKDNLSDELVGTRWYCVTAGDYEYGLVFLSEDDVSFTIKEWYQGDWYVDTWKGTYQYKKPTIFLSIIKEGEEIVKVVGSIKGSMMELTYETGETIFFNKQ